MQQSQNPNLSQTPASYAIQQQQQMYYQQQNPNTQQSNVDNQAYMQPTGDSSNQYSHGNAQLQNQQRQHSFNKNQQFGQQEQYIPSVPQQGFVAQPDFSQPAVGSSAAQTSGKVEYSGLGKPPMQSSQEFSSSYGGSVGSTAVSVSGSINPALASYQQIPHRVDQAVSQQGGSAAAPRIPVLSSFASGSASTTFRTSSLGMQQTATLHSSTKPALELRLQQLHPSVLPREMMENLEEHSVEVLCSIGREITQDLMFRALNLLSVMKMSVSNNNRNSAIDVETILIYCQTLFTKLAEVRIRIDLKRSEEAVKNGTSIEDSSRISDDKLFELFSSPQPVKVDARKQKLSDEFEANRVKLVRLSSQLKKLDWLAAVSDPRFLKQKLDGSPGDKR